MYPAIVLDLSRLYASPLVDTPRGVPRVEYAYARYFVEKWPGECVAAVPTPWGPRWYDRRRTIAGLEFVDAHWRESQAADQDAAYRSIKSQLLGRNVVAPRPFTTMQKLSAVKRGLTQVGITLGHSMVRELPARSI